MSNDFIRQDAADRLKRLDTELRQVGGLDIHTLRVLAAPLTLAWEIVADGVIIGSAAPGSATSSPVWSVKKILTTVAPGRIVFANGNPGFEHVWDDYASFTYS